MIFISNPFYATVWSVNPNEKYIDLRISTSKKKQDGTYDKDSGWFPRVLGHALNALKDVKEKDRICVTKASIENPPYTAQDGKTKSAFKMLIYEAEILSNDKQKNTYTSEAEQPKQVGETAKASEPYQPAAGAADECPW